MIKMSTDDMRGIVDQVERSGGGKVLDLEYFHWFLSTVTETVVRVDPNILTIMKGYLN